MFYRENYSATTRARLSSGKRRRKQDRRFLEHLAVRGSNRPTGGHDKGPTEKLEEEHPEIDQKEEAVAHSHRPHPGVSSRGRSMAPLAESLKSQRKKHVFCSFYISKSSALSKHKTGHIESRFLAGLHHINSGSGRGLFWEWSSQVNAPAPRKFTHLPPESFLSVIGLLGLLGTPVEISVAPQ